MPISIKKAKSALTVLDRFYSKYTGTELEESIATARKLGPFIDQNIAVPAIEFTGDFSRVEITKLTKDMWLESVTLVCRQAFSESSKDINYEIAMDHATLVAIPNEFMRDPGTVLVYNIDRIIPTGSTIATTSTSTRAFGNIHVKLNFR